MTAVHIPATITSIDVVFFQLFPNATSIVVDEGNENFSSYNGMLFDNELTSLISVPEGIEGAAVLPKSLASVPAYVFSRCTKLLAISQGSAAIAQYSTSNGLLYSKDMTQLIAASAGLGTTATIAPECMSIQEGAFAGNYDLRTIVVNGVVSVDASAFEQEVIEGATVVLNVAAEDYDAARAEWEAAGFTNFTDPAEPGQTIEPVEGSGFAFTLLDNYTLAVRWQGEEAAPANVQIPSYGTIDGVCYAVTAIADDGFAGQDAIENVNIPSGIMRIGANAFAQTGIQAVGVPGSVTEIGNGAFSDCTSLVAIDLTNGLRNIGAYAFANVAANTIVLPATVEAIGDYAFANSPNLQMVLALGQISSVASTALSGCTNVKVYVPYSESGEYAWGMGAPVSNNHLLPYGVKVQGESITLEEGQTANIFDNGGYLEAPEGFEVNYSYKAKPLSVDGDGNVEAVQAGSSVVEAEITFTYEREVAEIIQSEEVKLEQAALKTSKIQEQLTVSDQLGVQVTALAAAPLAYEGISPQADDGTFTLYVCSHVPFTATTSTDGSGPEYNIAGDGTPTPTIDGIQSWYGINLFASGTASNIQTERLGTPRIRVLAWFKNIPAGYQFNGFFWDEACTQPVGGLTQVEGGFTGYNGADKNVVWAGWAHTMYIRSHVPFTLQSNITDENGNRDQYPITGDGNPCATISNVKGWHGINKNAAGASTGIQMYSDNWDGIRVLTWHTNIPAGYQFNGFFWDEACTQPVGDYGEMTGNYLNREVWVGWEHTMYIRSHVPFTLQSNIMDESGNRDQYPITGDGNPCATISSVRSWHGINKNESGAATGIQMYSSNWDGIRVLTWHTNVPAGYQFNGFFWDEACTQPVGDFGEMTGDYLHREVWVGWEHTMYIRSHVPFTLQSNITDGNGNREQYPIAGNGNPCATISNVKGWHGINKNAAGAATGIQMYSDKWDGIKVLTWHINIPDGYQFNGFFWDEACTQPVGDFGEMTGDYLHREVWVGWEHTMYIRSHVSFTLQSNIKDEDGNRDQYPITGDGNPCATISNVRSWHGINKNESGAATGIQMYSDKWDGIRVLTWHTNVPAGYQFNGFFWDEACTQPVGDFGEMTGNYLNREVWVGWEYPITYIDSEGETLSWDSGKSHPSTYKSSQTVKIDAPSKPNRVFKGWSTDGTNFSQTITLPMGTTGGKTYTAYWYKNPTVTWDVTTNGGKWANASDAVAATTVVYGQKPTLPAKNPVKDNYVFVGWSTNRNDTTGATTQSALAAVGESNVTYYAIYRAGSASFKLLSEGVAVDTITGNFGGTLGSKAGTALPNPPARPGYTFLKWTTDQAGMGTAVTTYPQTFTALNMVYYAQWSKDTYSITYTGGGFGDGGDATWPSGISHPVDYQVDTNTFTIGAPARDHYTFMGWKVNGASNTVMTYTVAKGSTGNITLEATWKENLVITWALGYWADYGATWSDGTTVTDIEMEVPYGSTPDFPRDTPIKSGWAFVGWHDNPDEEGDLYDGVNVQLPTLTSNTTFYAQFEEGKSTIMFNANGGTGGPRNITRPTGSVLTNGLFPIESANPTREGYTFVNWNTEKDGSGVTANKTIGYPAIWGGIIPDGTTILWAQWDVIEYTITYSNMSDTSGNDAWQAIWPDGAHVPYVYNVETDDFTIGAPRCSDESLSFAGWTVDLNDSVILSSDGMSVTVPKGTMGDIQLSANWETNPTVTWKLNADGATWGASGGSADKTTYPALGTVPVKPSETPTLRGHAFVGWSTDPSAESGIADDTFPAVMADTTYYAIFKAGVASIVFDANGGQGVPVGITGTYNDALPTTGFPTMIPTRTGYEFVGWNLNDKAAPDASDMIPAADGSYALLNGGKFPEDTTTLYAIWRANTYTVKFDVNDDSEYPADAVSDISATYDVEFAIPELPKRPGGWIVSGAVWQVLGDSGEVIGDFAPTSVSGTKVKNLTSVNNGTVTLRVVWEPVYSIQVPTNAALWGQANSVSINVLVEDGKVEEDGQTGGALAIKSITPVATVLSAQSKANIDDSDQAAADKAPALFVGTDHATKLGVLDDSRFLFTNQTLVGLDDNLAPADETLAVEGNKYSYFDLTGLDESNNGAFGDVGTITTIGAPGKGKASYVVGKLALELANLRGLALNTEADIPTFATIIWTVRQPSN